MTATNFSKPIDDEVGVLNSNIQCLTRIIKTLSNAGGHALYHVIDGIVYVTGSPSTLLYTWVATQRMTDQALPAPNHQYAFLVVNTETGDTYRAIIMTDGHLYAIDAIPANNSYNFSFSYIAARMN